MGMLQWVQPVSRRACNASYIVWSLALNWTMLLLFLTGEVFSASNGPLALLAACSSNMLPVFLLSNVLTGAVNMLLDTLVMPDRHAQGIVCVYMFLVCGIAFVLHVHNTKIKFGLW